MKQMKLFSEKVVKEFGGSLSKNKGKRKVARPLVFSKPMHLVLKTSKAKGQFAFSPTDHRVKSLITKMGQRFGVKIYSTSQNWSHIHLVIRLRDRKSYRSFIRALTGAMVLKLKATKGFFDLTPYTKVASWGRQFQNLKNYAFKNELQALGLLENSSKKNSKCKRQHQQAQKHCKINQRMLA
jgi:REP element-mobilizing transposase RayT